MREIDWELNHLEMMVTQAERRLRLNTLFTRDDMLNRELKKAKDNLAKYKKEKNHEESKII